MVTGRVWRFSSVYHATLSAEDVGRDSGLTVVKQAGIAACCAYGALYPPKCKYGIPLSRNHQLWAVTGRARRELSAKGHLESMLGEREVGFVNEVASAMCCGLRGIRVHRGLRLQQLVLRYPKLSLGVLLWIWFGPSTVQVMKLPSIFKRKISTFICSFVCLMCVWRSEDTWGDQFSPSTL